MISELLLLTLFAQISLTFTPETKDHTQHLPGRHLSFPAPCPQRFTDLAKAAVIACQKDKLPDTTDCMTDEMKKYRLQSWNVLVKTSDDVADITSFWAPSFCIIKLENFGVKYNRSYTLWQALNYNNDATLTDELQAEQKPQKLLYKYTQGLQHQKPIQTSDSDELRGDCEQWKIDSVKNLIQYCDLAGNERSGQCIRDRIKDEMGEYWSVYIKTTINSAITIWFAECYTTLQGYGAFVRYIRPWS